MAKVMGKWVCFSGACPRWGVSSRSVHTAPMATQERPRTRIEAGIRYVECAESRWTDIRLVSAWWYIGCLLHSAARYDGQRSKRPSDASNDHRQRSGARLPTSISSKIGRSTALRGSCTSLKRRGYLEHMCLCYRGISPEFRVLGDELLILPISTYFVAS
jgi:hypothetical protein